MNNIHPSTPKRPGDLDIGFGIAGTVTLPIEGTVDTLTPAGNGKILGTIGGRGGFVLFRLDADGQLDANFGENGLARGRLGNFDNLHTPTTIRVLPDGRIFVGGRTTLALVTDPGHACPGAALFHADGSPDLDFGTGGHVEIILEPPSTPLRAPATTSTPVPFSERDLLFTYDGLNTTLEAGVVICLTTSGQLNTRFAGRGYTWHKVGGLVTVRFNDCALQSNGTLVVIGGNRWMPHLAGFDAEGAMPADFAYGGERSFGHSYQVGLKLAIRADDRILCIGSSDNNSFIQAMQTNGLDDPSFNGGGQRHLYGVPKGAEIALDDRLVYAGSENNHFLGTLARLEPDGRLDATFGANGTIRQLGIALQSMALQHDGNMVIGGSAVDSQLATLKRYLGA